MTTTPYGEALSALSAAVLAHYTAYQAWHDCPTATHLLAHLETLAAMVAARRAAQQLAPTYEELHA